MLFIPLIAIRKISLSEGPLFHLRLQCRGNLAGNILGIQRIDHVLQRNEQALIRAVCIETVKLLLDGYKPKTDLRENSLKISPGLNVISTKPAEIAYHQTFDPAALNVGHQTVKLRSVENCAGSSIVNIGVDEVKIRAVCDIGFAYLDLICNDIHIL